MPSGFAFVPLALFNGGRPGKGAQKLIQMVYTAVRDVCDEFYWYGTLVPRLWAALGRGCFHHALGVRRDILAARSHGEGVDDGSGPPIPGPAASAARWDFEEFEDCDARWSWASDGTCAFEFERGQTYYDFLRAAHPAWFAATA